MDKYYVGVDIGNTKTHYVLSDQKGNVKEIFFDIGASHDVHGLEEAEKIIKCSFMTLIDRAEVSIKDIKYIFYGTVGADTEDDFLLLREMFNNVTPNIPFGFENHGFIALKSGTIDGNGIAITCGASNSNFAMNSSGICRRIGGLTSWTGDTLGAANIAALACRAAVRSKDARSYPSILSKMLPDALDIDNVEDIKNLDMEPGIITTIVKTFFMAAELGDGRALEITWMLTKEVINIVREFKAALFNDIDKFKVVLEGTVFKNNYRPLMRMIELSLHQRYNLDIIIPEWDPVLGALFFAFEKDGVPMTKKLLEIVIKTYLDKRKYI